MEKKEGKDYVAHLNQQFCKAIYERDYSKPLSKNNYVN